MLRVHLIGKDSSHFVFSICLLALSCTKVFLLLVESPGVSQIKMINNLAGQKGVNSVKLKPVKLSSSCPAVIIRRVVLTLTYGNLRPYISLPFSCFCMQASRDNPRFKEMFNSTEQAIDVQFASLKVILHQEALLHLVEFANNLFPTR